VPIWREDKVEAKVSCNSTTLSTLKAACRYRAPSQVSNSRLAFPWTAGYHFAQNTSHFWPSGFPAFANRERTLAVPLWFGKHHDPIPGAAIYLNLQCDTSESGLLRPHANGPFSSSFALPRSPRHVPCPSETASVSRSPFPPFGARSLETGIPPAGPMRRNLSGPALHFVDECHPLLPSSTFGVLALHRPWTQRGKIAPKGTVSFRFP
jgi:hypothetical protein